MLRTTKVIFRISHIRVNVLQFCVVLLQVNLDSKTRDLTIQLLQAPSHTSLSYAQKRIYSLLDTDCYPRFLQSNIYLSLLQQTDS